jgi:hypothetical protein
MCPASSAGQVTPCYKGAHLLVRQKCPSANSPRSLAVARGHPDDERQMWIWGVLFFCSKKNTHTTTGRVGGSKKKSTRPTMSENSGERRSLRSHSKSHSAQKKALDSSKEAHGKYLSIDTNLVVYGSKLVKIFN